MIKKDPDKSKHIFFKHPQLFWSLIGDILEKHVSIIWCENAKFLTPYTNNPIHSYHKHFKAKLVHRTAGTFQVHAVPN